MSTLISTRFIVTHLLIIGLVLTFANHVSPANGATTRARVIVSVSSKSHPLVIKGYLYRALHRGLGDVEICSDLDWDLDDLDIATFEISVVHMQRESSGLHIFSTTIRSLISPFNFNSNAKSLLKHASLARHPCIVWEHLLYTGGANINELSIHCEHIVGKFAQTLLRQANTGRRTSHNLTTSDWIL